MFYEKTVLDNGLTVISEKMDSVKSINLGLWFSVGSRDETPERAGLTHFMEHMMFKGTPSMDAAQISAHFDSLGAELNAFTSREYTCYYSRFVDSKLEQALSVLADMVINSDFSDECIETEREVVIEEIARSVDAPDDSAYELFCQSITNGHAIGLPVLGTKERVSSYCHEDCASFHQDFYHAGNLTVAAAGNLEHEVLVELCKKYFASMNPGKRQVRVITRPNYVSGIFTEKRDIEQAHIFYGFPWLESNHPYRYIAGVLTTILGGSMSSRLFQEVREKRGLVYSIYAMQSTYLGSGQWCIYAGTRPDNVGEVVDLIKAELEKISSDLVDEEELQRAIDLICGQLVLGLETTTAHMSRLGKFESLGLEQISLEDSLSNYRKVTSLQVKELAASLLTAEPTIAVVSPFELKEITDMLNA